MYNKDKHKLNEKDLQKIINFNKKYMEVEFIYGDAIDIIQKYKDNSNVFIFLDPPFLLTSSFYSATNVKKL